MFLETVFTTPLNPRLSPNYFFPVLSFDRNKPNFFPLLNLRSMVMGIISPLHHFNLIPSNNSVTKFCQQRVGESHSCRVSLERFSLHSSSKNSSPGKFNLDVLVKASPAQMLKLSQNNDSDVKVLSSIKSYLALGDFCSAAMTFFVGFEQHLCWNSFLKEFTNFGGNPSQILQVFVKLYGTGFAFSSEIIVEVLNLCANSRHSRLGLEIHACCIKGGFDMDANSKCALINFYERCWDLDKYKEGFGETSNHKSSMWNQAVLLPLMNEKWFEGLQAFRGMQFSFVKASSFTIAKVLQACSKVGARYEGKQIHAYIIRNAMESNLLICNALISMYMKTGRIQLARVVFDRMENLSMRLNIVSWNTLLSGHLRCGSYRDVLLMLREMQNAGFEPNSRSITVVLQAVSELRFSSLGKSIHGYIIRKGLDRDLHVVSSLLDMYVKINNLISAQIVFDGMEYRNTFAWNSMISGYSFKGNFVKAVRLFNQMEKEGIRPDLVTYNGIVSGYSMAGRINDASAMLMEIKKSDLTPNVVTWTALISGSSQNGYHKKALEFWHEMQREGVKPNSTTIASILRGCTGLSLLWKGKEVHCLSIRRGYIEDAYVCTALVDLYCKCGDLKSAHNAFQKAQKKTLATWNSMVMGFSTHGHGKAAISLFHKLQVEANLQPNAITMTALLSGCRHPDLIKQGRKYFDSMEAQYGIIPSIEHYSCMVDLLGRTGHIDEAWDLIRQMPIEPNSTVWGAFLRSCRIWDNIQLGEIAAKKLFELEPRNPANYVLLMNMYAASRRWDDVDTLKDAMNEKSLKVGNVWSWTEVGRTINVFSAKESSHQDEEIYFELHRLISRIKKMGYVPDTKCVYENVSEDEKEKALLCHTEKLAITYGLIKSKTTTVVRVFKNIRTCADCHTFAKYISLATGHEIIIKDGIRFHHFAQGKCSCEDVW